MDGIGDQWRFLLLWERMAHVLLQKRRKVNRISMKIVRSFFVWVHTFGPPKRFQPMERDIHWMNAYRVPTPDSEVIDLALVPAYNLRMELCEPEDV